MNPESGSTGQDGEARELNLHRCAARDLARMLSWAEVPAEPANEDQDPRGLRAGHIKAFLARCRRARRCQPEP